MSVSLGSLMLKCYKDIRFFVCLSTLSGARARAPRNIDHCLLMLEARQRFGLFCRTEIWSLCHESSLKFDSGGIVSYKQ